ncbi:AMP-binding protein [Haliea sp.]|uniref:AMP-binding protein n=1 Tax=Haliea sp. TaxID=1932666 RepID=UPI003526CBD4
MFIAQYIFDFAARTPSAPAIIYNDHAISYHAFAGAIARAAGEVAAALPQPRGTVAVMVHNLADCWVATLALQARGYTTICVASLEVLASLEIRPLLGVVVCGENTDTVEPCELAPVLTLGKPVFDDALAFGTPPLAEDVDDCGHILFTSGTSGKYKKVLVPARVQRESDRERCDFQGYDSSTRYHALGFGLWTGNGYKAPTSVWHVGGTAILDQRSDWVEPFVCSGVTRATLLPDMALRLSECESLAQMAIQTGARPILYMSGGFVSARVVGILREHFDVFNSYGCTEVGLGVLWHDYALPADLSWMVSTGARVVEVENASGQLCAVNEEGRLRIKLTELDASGYMDDPEATRAAFREGYFYPGDQAIQREDGAFRILGRTADVVNLAGQKLAVAPIEANLQNVLQVNYVCLFAGVTASGEPEVVIAMEAAELPSRDRLDHVGQEFSQWGEVRFALLDTFPRTQSGTSKIDRKRLKSLLFPV